MCVRVNSRVRVRVSAWFKSQLKIGGVEKEEGSRRGGGGGGGGGGEKEGGGRDQVQETQNKWEREGWMQRELNW